MHVPGHSGLSSGFSVVVVVVVVGGGVGRGWRNGGGFLEGDPPPPPPGLLKRPPRPRAGARTGRRELATLPRSVPPPLLVLAGPLGAGFLWGGGGRPPPPSRDPRAGAMMGRREAAAPPAPELPVAAFRRVPKTWVRSGPTAPPPPPDGRYLGGGGGWRCGTRSMTCGGCLLLSLDLQQTVHFWQESMFVTSIGQVVDLFLVPNWQTVGPFKVRDLFRSLVLKVEQPDV